MTREEAEKLMREDKIESWIEDERTGEILVKRNMGLHPGISWPREAERQGGPHEEPKR